MADTTLDMTPAAESRPTAEAPRRPPPRPAARFAPRRFAPGYSRFVAMMKFMLPAGAFALIGLVVLWPQFSTDDLRFRLGFAAIKSTIGADPSMLNPRYVGTDSDDKPYSITADLARRLKGSNAEIETLELEMPKADITLDDGTWLVLTAETGLYARDAKTLDLEGSVNLFHDTGYEFRTSRAAIDLTSGIASGNVPIQGQGPFGNLEAEGFKLVDKGKTIYFTGKSKLTLYPRAGKNRQ